MVLDGRYRLTSKLGEGGNGVVYEARHILLQRVVAVKLLRYDSEDNEDMGQAAIARLLREARLASAAGHPNICTVFDVGCDAEQPFIVMEMCQGLTLGDAIARRKKLRVELATEIMVQVLSAVEAAHRAGVIHRDIKPKNIFLQTRIGCAPVVKVLDFGLAKDITGPKAITQRFAQGTPMYMAPEQLATGRVDFRSDVYTCGLVLLEMLTGSLPRTQLEMLRDGNRDAAPSPAAWTGLGFDPAIEQVISRALAFEPTNRFQSAVEFQTELLSVCPWLLDAAELFAPLSSTQLPSLGGPDSSMDEPVRAPLLDGSAQDSSQKATEATAVSNTLAEESPLLTKH